MIERVARCLDIGGRLSFRGSKNKVRSHRHLHSAFWSHGAGNINLPAWWIFLLQTPITTGEGRANPKRLDFRKAVSSGLEDIFLDFLYPVQTLALIRRLQQSTTAHNHAAQNAKQYSRSFTSIAKEFITRAKASRVGSEAYSTSSASNHTGDALQTKINDILNSNDPSDRLDELWQNYQDLLEDSQALLPQGLIKMLRCLSLSKRTVDLERALALFESIPLQNRRAIHYSHAVSAALALKDLDTALSIHREARSRINGSIGTAAIMGFVVQQELWPVAIELWHPFWENKLSYYTNRDIWAAVSALPLENLIQKAINVADFANSVCESMPGERATIARDFATELIRHAFNVRGTKFNVDSHCELVDKTKSLDDAHDSIRILALEQLLSVDTREHRLQALSLYQLLRGNTAFSPGHKLLSAVSHEVLKEDTISDVSTMVDDWRTYSFRLPAGFAIRAARVFAKNGDVVKTQRLFDDFISDYGKPKHDALYHHMLLAYSRRADIQGVLQCFNDLQESYDFKPTLTAWNSVIATFARVGDVPGALTYFEKLRGTDLQPDATTFFLLISMYGERGDLEAVQQLFEQSRSEGVRTTIKMYDAVVLAHVNNGNLEESERILDQALQLELEGSRTFMWNVVINAYALRRNVEKVSQMHRRMQQSGVSSDNMTYAALMTSLTVAKIPKAARKILQVVMPQNGMKPTALHYAIVMRGCLEIQEYGEIFQLFQKMLDNGLSANLSTQNVLLRAAAAIDKAAASENEESTGETAFVRAKQIFEQTVENLDPTELSASEPRMYVGANPLNEAFSSTYFEYLIFLHGKEAAFDKASELFERYVSAPRPLQASHQEIENSPPMRLLSALMVCHIGLENHAEVDRCWKLALEKSKQLACKSNADTFSEGWVLHSRRFIINLVLHHYLTSVANQNRISDIIETIRDLHLAGYALNSSNWNNYIQALARSPQLAHRFGAFHLCEEELMPQWLGWAKFGNPKYMQPKFSAMQRNMLLWQDQKAPTYLTLVWLARAYLEIGSHEKQATMKQLREAGPKTVDAIVNMPRLNDRAQNEILRQQL